MMPPLHVLLVEDSEDDALLILRTLKKSGYNPSYDRVQTAAGLAAALANGPWDIILCDYHLPGFSGLDAISILQETKLDIPLIIVSGAIGEETALNCIHRGASDYIMKGNPARLGLSVERELEKKQMRARQKQDEEALKQSEEKFKTIANYTVDWESWFGPDGTCLWVNPAVERITGYAAQDIMAMPDFIAVMIAEEDQSSFRLRFQDALTGTRGDNFEIRYVHKNGERLWLSLSWQPVFDAEGRFLGIRTSGRDITAAKKAEEERLHLEKQLFEAQKMEAMGSLAGGIAHDFNNILGGIIGYAEINLSETNETLRQENLQQILQAAERARDLVRRILSFSRHGEQDKKFVDIRTVIDEALTLLRATMPATIEIRQALPDKPVNVYADTTQLHQVMMNLCTNAAHAMGEKGGLLSIAMAERRLSYSEATDHNLRPGHYINLSISDTGPGIDSAIIERIFDPFFTTKKIGEGTGLGLSVVYGIMQNHDGTVQARNNPGPGATFEIFLPLAEPSGPKENAAETKATLIGGTESILFVDDEKELAVLMQRILVKLGYRITMCTDSREALRLFQTDPSAYDLVITDMTMPYLSGSELARHILQIKPGQPVILCTGYSSFVNAEKAAEMGIKAFLLKPLTKRVLAKTVRQALDDRHNEHPTRS